MRQNVSSNSPFERVAAYSRAVRVGNAVYVAGTGAWGADGKIVPGGVDAQTK